ncbi:alpha/beta fold hydrolase [Roseibaca sp. Y0-43]|uniref:alpha/beta fold hydrolase n=1 Tax=Roseibaca sp. Y0-43 TaxID=2816854 RepID=UPI001D0C7178|nr:alpha/beta fold hydrolase [Roseibaca sp. Y0-43]MCC1482369.1 alpha/beta fold hydrolase [Roseibaca sp. Y0-43]
MRLAQVVHGSEGAAPPLLIVHGLFGSARNWGAIAKRLSSDRQVIAVDMRNHGDSPWTDTHDYPAMAADLAEVIAAHGAPMDVLGHSMGGKATMLLALTRPELVNRLLVADIAPVAYGHTQRPLVAAMQGLDLSALSTRASADAALAITVPDPGVRAFLLQSLDLRAEPPRWRLNLPVLDREMDKIIGWPDTVAGQFDGPTLFLSGAKSDYMQADYRPAIKALFPNAKFAKIPNAGHWLHAEAPRPFEASVRAWLD